MTTLAVRKLVYPDHPDEDNIELCADSQMTYQSAASQTAKVYIEEGREPKDNLIFLSTGSLSQISLMKLYVREHWGDLLTFDEEHVTRFIRNFYASIKELTGKWPEDHNDWFFIKDFRIFACAHLAVWEIEDFCAMGSGQEYAKAVLFRGGSTAQAVDAACQFDIYSSKPYSLYTMQRDGTITKFV